MKIKEIDRTANVAWSPHHQYPIYLAAGTAAQQLDASFSTSAALEVYALNLGDPSHDMVLRSSTQSEHRFHKLCWGHYGGTSGTIVGGCDGGIVQVYSSAKLLKGEPGLAAQLTKHRGSVRAVDFNTFQSNLLATGASDSEIFIWDLNNPTTPMTPGGKSQPAEDVTSIGWNKQVQHILASSFAAKCVVWDLRKNDAIIKLSDTTSRVRWNQVAWNPAIATQLCLASEEDATPVIQLWDLRFATSPLKVLDSHQRGVLSISWCVQDTDMLLSCGKDSRILCCNPNTTLQGTEVICEIHSANQWHFDVAFCPRNPALFVSSSFDGRVSVYSLVGGPQQVQTSNKIADSFPGMEHYTQAQAPQAVQAAPELRRAPRWLKRPVRASFGFGGKLVTFEAPVAGEPGVAPARVVTVSQVVTEPELVQRSGELEAALRAGHFAEYCQGKVAASQGPHARAVWQFLGAHFEPSPRAELLALLGFRPDELNGKLAKFLGKPANQGHRADMAHISGRLAALGPNADSESEAEGCDDGTSHGGAGKGGEDGEDSGAAAFDAIASQRSPAPGTVGGADSGDRGEPLRIATGDDTDGLICQALLLGNTEAAVDLCLQDNRMADAIILAMTGGPDLLARTQYRYFQQSSGYLATLISALVSEDWSQVVRRCDLSSWREALAAALTHTTDGELSALCSALGGRLAASAQGAPDAEICFICAGSYSDLVHSRLSRERGSSSASLQDLVELAMVLKKAVELQGKPAEVSARLADLLREYALMLAAQGNLDTALAYLTTAPGEDSGPAELQELRDRLQCSLRMRQAPQPHQPHHQHQQHQPPQPRSRTVSANHDRFNLNPFTGPGQQPAVPPVAPVGAFPAPSPGPTHASGGITSRSKHVLDPSVQSAPHSQYFQQQQQQQQAGYGGPMQHQPQPGAFAPQQGGYFQQPPGAQTAPGTFYPPGPAAPFVPAPPAPTPPPAVAPPPAMMSQPPQGWNDPPALGPSRNPGSERSHRHVEMSAEHAGTRRWREMIAHSHPQQPKAEVAPQAPITHPLFGAAPDPYSPAAVPGMPSAANGFNGYPSQQYDPYQQQQQHQPPPQQQYPPPMQQGQPGQTYQSFQQPPQPEHPPHAAPAPTPPAPVPKKPIPDEHQVLQTVLDQLKNSCAAAANSPQWKRKLDEVARKLDSLYDGLRDGRLSSNTLQGLHVLVQHVQTGDYTTGLMLHTQLVSGPDFSQIATFMPGIKVLLQTALQLQVYL